jgi:hypothetical protein
MKKLAGPIAAAVLGAALVGSSARAYSSYGYRSRPGGGASGGLALGVNLAKVTGDAEDTGLDGLRIGFCGGLLVEAPMSYDVSVLTGFMLTQKGGEGSVDATSYGFPGVVADVEMELDFVEFPLLLKVSGGRRQPYAVLGISVGVNTKADLAIEAPGYSGTIDVDDDTEDTEVSVIVGAGAPLGSIGTIGVQYSLGMKDLDERPGEELKTRTISVMVGVKF